MGWFRKKETDVNAQVGGAGWNIPSSQALGNNLLNQVHPEYRFNLVGTPQPGQAYHAPLLQFQTYPKNLWQGHGGVRVLQYFKSFEPQWLNQPLQPVSGGTSGTITGQLAFQPLVDTTGGNSTVG
jgi:hypothetical protein